MGVEGAEKNLKMLKVKKIIINDQDQVKLKINYEETSLYACKVSFLIIIKCHMYDIFVRHRHHI